jgi:hypothetical protein
MAWVACSIIVRTGRLYLPAVVRADPQFSGAFSHTLDPKRTLIRKGVNWKLRSQCDCDMAPKFQRFERRSGGNA